MNEENKMTKLALGEQARPQPIRQGSQPAGKNKFKFFAPRNLARGQVSGGLEEAAWLGLELELEVLEACVQPGSRHMCSKAPGMCPTRLQKHVSSQLPGMFPIRLQKHVSKLKCEKPTFFHRFRKIWLLPGCGCAWLAMAGYAWLWLYIYSRGCRCTAEAAHVQQGLQMYSRGCTSRSHMDPYELHLDPIWIQMDAIWSHLKLINN